MLVFQNDLVAELKLPDLIVRPEPVTEDVTRFDMRFEMTERFDTGHEPLGIKVSLTHALAAIGTDAAQGLLDHLVAILRDVAVDPSMRVADLGRSGRGGAVETARRSRPSRARDDGSAPSAAFVCSPYGQQWVGMARSMYTEEPAFASVLNEWDDALQPYTGWSLTDELFLDAAHMRTDDVGVMQPIVCAIEVGIARWLEASGMVPSAVAGHSLGEIAACVIAGMIDLNTAARIVYHYTDQQRRVAGSEHGMAVVELAAPELDRYVAASKGRVSVATRNGPRTTALSGDRAELQRIIAKLQDRDVLAAMVRVDLAAHSAAIDPIMSDLRSAIGPISARPGRLSMISSVTGCELEWRDLTASYFVDNLRRPVLLSNATAGLLGRRPTALVEISAHPILAPALQQSVEDYGRHTEVVTTMRRADDDRAGVRNALATLRRLGVGVAPHPSPAVTAISTDTDERK